MKCPNANELSSSVQRGIKKRQKALVKNLIDTIKYRTSTGHNDVNSLIDCEEDAQYCVDYFKQYGYTVILRRGALGEWKLYIKWGK